MKTAIICFSLLFCLQAKAAEKKAFVYVRKNVGGKLIKKEVSLTNLNNSEEVDGKHFKIVVGDSENAVKFSDEVYSLKASHVYHHLTMAYEGFKKLFGEDYVKKLPKIVSRLDIANGFADTAHFSSLDHEEHINNALTIPAASEDKDDDTASWGPEIWFRPAKVKKINNGLYEGSDIIIKNPEIRSNIYTTIANTTLTQMTSEFASTGFNIMAIDPVFHLETLVLSIGITELLPRALKLVSKIKKKKFYLDTAMIPEIIYHEFAHVGFSSYLSIDQHNAVVEGYANYFAGIVSKHYEILHHGGKFNTGYTGKSAKLNTTYDYNLEAPKMAQASFTFKLLWSVRENLGDKSDLVLLNALKFLNGSDSIKYDLSQSIHLSVKEIFTDKVEQNVAQYKISRIFSSLGL